MARPILTSCPHKLNLLPETLTGRRYPPHCLPGKFPVSREASENPGWSLPALCRIVGWSAAWKCPEGLPALGKNPPASSKAPGW